MSQPISPASPYAEELLELWEKTLLLDLQQQAEYFHHPAVETVFFGGGTPSLLPPAAIAHILDAAATLFSLDSSAEISMEANPESITADRASDFLNAGINRVSLGVQALDDALLAAVGRIHSKTDALRAFGDLRDAGCTNLGIDLMWGLPGENLSQWEQQLHEVVNLQPDHLSCYGLTLEENTPFWQDRECLALPDEDIQSAMYLRCGDILEQAGYQQYEISNYALPGHPCRHNLGYWQQKDYLGFGPSAVSTVQRQRWSQPDTITGWIERVHRHTPDIHAEKLSFAEQTEELIMLRLRTVKGLLLSEYQELTGHDFLHDNAVLIAKLQAEGLAVSANGFFRLTRRGMLISNAVIEHCFEHIPSAAAGELP